MDTTKTAIPHMQITTKLTASLGQFSINIRGIVMHGHGDGMYVHYLTDLPLEDSNFTISSLARLLWQLEEEPIQLSGDLFPHPPSNSFFEIFMWGKSQCMNILPEVLSTNPTRQVPFPSICTCSWTRVQRITRTSSLWYSYLCLHIVGCLRKFRLNSYWLDIHTKTLMHTSAICLGI